MKLSTSPARSSTRPWNALGMPSVARSPTNGASPSPTRQAARCNTVTPKGRRRIGWLSNGPREQWDAWLDPDDRRGPTEGLARGAIDARAVVRAIGTGHAGVHGISASTWAAQPPDGKRHTIQRRGFSTRKAAEAALTDVLSRHRRAAIPWSRLESVSTPTSTAGLPRRLTSAGRRRREPTATSCSSFGTSSARCRWRP